MIGSQEGAVPSHELDAMFAAADTDGDGQLDIDELSNWIADRKYNKKPSRVSNPKQNPSNRGCNLFFYYKKTV